MPRVGQPHETGLGPQHPALVLRCADLSLLVDVITACGALQALLQVVSILCVHQQPPLLLLLHDLLLRCLVLLAVQPASAMFAIKLAVSVGLHQPLVRPSCCVPTQLWLYATVG